MICWLCTEGLLDEGFMEFGVLG